MVLMICYVLFLPRRAGVRTWKSAYFQQVAKYITYAQYAISNIAMVAFANLD